MQVVKKQNISRTITSLVFIFVCCTSELFGQWAHENMKPATDKFDLRKALYAPIPCFNSRTMPIFCRWEFKLEQKTKFPIKLRLGTVQYTDNLEQKNSKSSVYPSH